MFAFTRSLKTILAVLAIAGLSATAHAGTKQISAKEAHEQASQGKIVLIDIREPREWKATGISPDAKLIALRDARFLQKLKQIKLAFSGKPIAVICAHGNRSRYVQRALVPHGYPDIIDVKLGMESRGGWVTSGLPVKKWSGK